MRHIWRARRHLRKPGLDPSICDVYADQFKQYVTADSLTFETLVYTKILNTKNTISHE